MGSGGRVSGAFVAEETGSREGWLRARTTGIGASETPVILGLSPWSSPLRVYAGKVAPEDVTTEETEAMEWGRRLEAVILEKYREETGRIVTPHDQTVLLRSTAYPYLTCTPDAWIHKAEGHSGLGLLEIKTASREEDWRDGVPRYYWAQVQHQMAVTGVGWASLAVLLNGRKFRWMDIERDQEWIDAVLLPAAADFWRRVEERDPPEPWAEDLDLVKALYPHHAVEEPVVLPAEAQEWDTELQEIKDQIAALMKRRDELQAKIIRALEGASAGVLPNGTLYTYTRTRRKPYTVKGGESFTLRRKAAKREEEGG